MNSDKRKIFIVIVILAILVVGIVFVRNRKKAETPVIDELSYEENSRFKQESDKQNEQNKRNVISVVSDKTTVKTGENLQIKVLFNATGRKIFGSDAVILYDPEYLTTRSDAIANGNFFENLPKKTVDAENGIIKISAFGAKNSGNDNSNELVSITFTAKSEGESNIDFVFEKGQTNTTTLVEEGTSQNILDEATGLTVRVES